MAKCIFKTAEIVAEVENGDLYFLHPITNQRVNIPTLCLYGWSGANHSDYVELVDFINDDDQLEQKIVDEIETIEYWNK